MSAPWLTSRRLRAHGLLLALAVWSIYAWVLATPTLRDRNGLVKGTDFLHFYTLGCLALEHRGADLYNMQAQSALAQQKVPQAGRLFFVPLYGPQVSLLFAPLAALPYAMALAIWSLANAAIYAVCCYAIWKACPNLQSERWTVLLLAIAYPAFFHLIAWGQTSALALACLTAAWPALRSNHLYLAGISLGCLIFKPQLALAAAAVFLLARAWKVIAGALAASAAQLAAAWIYYGTPIMGDYFHHLLHVREAYALLEPRPYQMHSLRAFWAMLVPWSHFGFGLYLATAILVLWVTFTYWKSPAPLSLRYSALLLATVLVSPHLTVYDLLILAPAFLLTADWLTTHKEDPQARWLGLLLYLAYALPLVGPLAQWTHLQLSVPVMLVLLWTLSRPEIAARPLPDPR
ncbi:MAG TPA: glycosyltransferase family 87 protein [Terriglobales bacterium]|nr:glycosyltransferase family 87 protein [Terriglobales bacterium]